MEGSTLIDQLNDVHARIVLTEASRRRVYANRLKQIRERGEGGLRWLTEGTEETEAEVLQIERTLRALWAEKRALLSQVRECEDWSWLSPRLDSSGPVSLRFPVSEPAQVAQI